MQWLKKYYLLPRVMQEKISFIEQLEKIDGISWIISLFMKLIMGSNLVRLINLTNSLLIYCLKVDPRILL